MGFQAKKIRSKFILFRLSRAVEYDAIALAFPEQPRTQVVAYDLLKLE
jgi:hypothetical protein